MSTQAPIEEAIRETALFWFTRARAADFGANDYAQLQHWLAQDPRHHDEYARLEQTWTQLGALRDHFSRPRPAPVRSFTARRVAVALAACVVGFFAVLFFRYPSELYQAPPGGHLSVQIAEGIQAELDADSAIEVAHFSLHPDVHLMRGSVYFDVKARHTGLQVHVAEITLHDIGTRFSATVIQNDGKVAVAEGQVEISTATSQMMLSTGQQVHFASEDIDTPISINPQQVAAWQNDAYRFDAAPLSEVADTIWRHSRLRIEIPDARISALTVSGNFDIQQPEKLVWAIAQIHELRVKKQPDGHWRLTQP